MHARICVCRREGGLEASESERVGRNRVCRREGGLEGYRHGLSHGLAVCRREGGLGSVIDSRCALSFAAVKAV